MMVLVVVRIKYHMISNTVILKNMLIIKFYKLLKYTQKFVEHNHTTWKFTKIVCYHLIDLNVSTFKRQITFYFDFV